MGPKIRELLNNKLLRVKTSVSRMILEDARSLLEIKKYIVTNMSREMGYAIVDKHIDKVISRPCSDRGKAYVYYGYPGDQEMSLELYVLTPPELEGIIAVVKEDLERTYRVDTAVLAQLQEQNTNLRKKQRKLGAIIRSYKG